MPMEKNKKDPFSRNSCKQEEQKLFLSYIEQLFNISFKAAAENPEHPQRFSRLKLGFLAMLL